MKKFTIFFIFILAITSNYFAQSFSGPAYGSVSGGVSITTNSFAKAAPVIPPGEAPVRNKIGFEFLPDYLNRSVSKSVKTSKHTNDPSITDITNINYPVVPVANFDGIPQTNSIPPDPYIAVGPNHIMTVVNSSFRISDKKGNTLKTITADNWYSNVLKGVSSFDPKVVYDHFDKRWVMVWLHQDDNKKEGYYLFSVSDDEDPMGTWYNYKFASNLNGVDTAYNWGDYQGVGFDDNYFYLTSNNFAFGGSYDYSKIRVIKKSQLYANNGGAVDYADFWNFSLGYGGYGIRPIRMYDDPGEFYFLQRSPYQTGNHFVLYTLKNPFNSPVFTAKTMPVSTYYNPTNAGQLGGGSMPIDGGSSHLRNEPVYRNGIIYMVHAVASGTSNQYSALRFLALDPVQDAVLDNQTFGAEGYWHYYPSIEVDAEGNMVITYSRSSENEYAGAFYVTRKANDETFSGSRVLQTGKGNYVKDFSSGRNRWGDYNGIWLDPADQSTIWMLTEYAAGTNIWGTWVGAIRMKPFDGIYAAASDTMLNLSNVEVGSSSDTLSFTINNYGNQQLVVSGVSNSNPEFYLTNVTLPVTLNTWDSLKINVVYKPQTIGNQNSYIEVNTNDPLRGKININAVAKAFTITPAALQTFYSITKSGSTTSLVTLDKQSGSSTVLGQTGIAQISSITVNPQNKQLYGLFVDGATSKIIRINSSAADAYTLFSVPLNLTSIAFDKDLNLFGISSTGALYKINPGTGEYNFIDSTGLSINAITINYKTDEMWASVGSNFYRGKDAVYKINKNNGDTTFVGKTKLTSTVNALVFDENGNLYGVSGSLIQANNFYSINTQDAIATLIGSTGQKGLKGLAFIPDGISDVKDDYATSIPQNFDLKQNYPNPFNPSTVIEFALPKDANIKLAVYNVIGEEIYTLAQGNYKAGYHKVMFNSNNIGNKLSSGIYLYRLSAIDQNGREFTDTKKLILIK